MWGRGGGGVYRLNTKDQWKKWTDTVTFGIRLGVCGGRLVAVRGLKGGVHSEEVMVWRGGRWSLMSEMLVGCLWPCLVSVSGGGLVVIGGICNGGSRLNTVQVFDGKRQTWHFGTPHCSNSPPTSHYDDQDSMDHC